MDLFGGLQIWRTVKPSTSFILVLGFSLFFCLRFGGTIKDLFFIVTFFFFALYIRLVKNVNNGLVNRIERVRLILLVH